LRLLLLHVRLVLIHHRFWARSSTSGRARHD
jgi:hypothetical protein